MTATLRAVSIRAVLLGGAVAVLLAVLGGAAWMAYDGSQHEAEELFDARLATSARVLETLVARQLQSATIASPIVIAERRSGAGHHYETRIAFQVRDAGGRLLARSASAPESPFAPLAAGFSTETEPDGVWRVFTLPSGRLWIQVAELDYARNELSQKLALTAVMPLIVGIPLVVFLLALLIRYGLAPLSQLAARIAAREPHSLGPIALSRTPREIAPVLDALNGLFERVQNALARERRFTADAAHELRTPLAALQVHAQNAARAASPAERESSLQRVLAGIQRTVRLVSQMLALSRAAAPAAETFQPITLRPLVDEALGDLRAQIEVDCDPPEDAMAIRGDRDRLLGLAVNLIDNALRHGGEGGPVRVELRRAPGKVTLTVIDEGPGIPRELRERVFESYYRIPGTRGSGSGLGLSIVHEVAHQHGARVEIDEGDKGRGTRVSVTFPAADGA